jgi:hypothetical protein
MTPHADGKTVWAVLTGANRPAADGDRADRDRGLPTAREWPAVNGSRMTRELGVRGIRRRLSAHRGGRGLVTRIIGIGTVVGAVQQYPVQ